MSESFPKLNTTERSLLIKFMPHGEDHDPNVYL